MWHRGLDIARVTLKIFYVRVPGGKRLRIRDIGEFTHGRADHQRKIYLQFQPQTSANFWKQGEVIQKQ
jgi:hypothetical protein